ncbi:MAG: hypothetical protein GY871_04280 [Actinomycetales bacterium]|nr:hypothetical protein [Actinomycetales bacterium]
MSDSIALPLIAFYIGALWLGCGAATSALLEDGLNVRSMHLRAALGLVWPVTLPVVVVGVLAVLLFAAFAACWEWLVDQIWIRFGPLRRLKVPEGATPLKSHHRLLPGVRGFVIIEFDSYTTQLACHPDRDKPWHLSLTGTWRWSCSDDRGRKRDFGLAKTQEEALLAIDAAFESFARQEEEAHYEP